MGKRSSGLLGRYLLSNQICTLAPPCRFFFFSKLGREYEEKKWGGESSYIQVIINGVVKMSVLVIIYPKIKILSIYSRSRMILTSVAQGVNNIKDVMYIPSSSIFEIEFVIFALAGFQLQDRRHRDSRPFPFFFIFYFYLYPFALMFLCRSIQNEDNNNERHTQ